ncbi:acyl-CoA synthetase [Desertimonas flava]|uniref:acyl-CoA synthetase n=1 Tax=Desertimonas flava TaxID=2064846 RepID=UPI000E34ADC8|nr:acyl-CoA synthetase [Desertimonas flava]
MTTEWNIADVYEAVAAAVPDRPCQIQGDRVITWREFDRRASALAADLASAGLVHQSKVANYLYNGVEYLEGLVGALKGGFAPVNTNYRYGPQEIYYLFDNADAEAVIFDTAFTELLDGIRGDLTKVKRWYAVRAQDPDASPVPEWAVDYEAVVTGEIADVPAPKRTSDDLLLLYTGGTTGMPKGVMWRQDDLFNVLGAGGNIVAGLPPATSVAEVGERAAEKVPPVQLVACPLMHGTGQFSALMAMADGGCVVSLAGRRFDPAELFATVEARKVTGISIVGQAFAGPMLDYLEANPGAHNLSSLLVIMSSGVMWSQENKTGLLRHMPTTLLYDSFGSSEAVGLGANVSAAGVAEQTARFMQTDNNAVFTEDGRRVEPGSDEIGMVAVGGYIPVGYYKDPVKSAATFREYEGRRWSIPGDFAQVNADGTIHLLGRGSVCINTGGEKVFPEEVEEALKTHPSVRDAVAVGVPDSRFGETIAAVVEPFGDATPTLEELKAHVSSKLAAYKAPRHLVIVESIARAVNGKVDYKRLKQLAVDTVGSST